MARFTLSPLAAHLYGKLGSAVFAHTRGIPWVRTLGRNRTPPSDPQLTRREAYGRLFQIWQSINCWAIPPWLTYLTGTADSPWNGFVRMNLNRLISGLTPYLTPPALYPPMDWQFCAYAAAFDRVWCRWNKWDAYDSHDKVLCYYVPPGGIDVIYSKTRQQQHLAFWPFTPTWPGIWQLYIISWHDVTLSYGQSHGCFITHPPP